MPADQSSHCHANAVKGGELSYMALALEHEPTAYRSLLMVSGAVLADPEPMLARLEWYAAASPRPSLLACPLLHASTALLMPSRAASSATWHWRWNASQLCTDRATADGGQGGPGQP